MAASDVEYAREDYSQALAMWQDVRDAIAGEFAVKQERERYLPRPNPTDESVENKARYDSYLARAVYTNFVGRTLDGMIGLAFGDWPEIGLPESLDEVLRTDADGTGVGLIGLAQLSLSETLQAAHSGLLVDYPATATSTSVADQTSGAVRPFIMQYASEQIINWRRERRGNQSVWTLIVLKECEERPGDDGFSTDNITVYRVLRLDQADNYVMSVWAPAAGDNGGEMVETVYNPVDGKGKPWKVIPFTFIGAVNNDGSLSKPPMYDMAKLNLAHYRNSADAEESGYLVGQPTLWLAGLDVDWRDEMQKSGVYMGSREAFLLPAGGSAGLLQAQPNNLPTQMMKDKEESIAALGARMLIAGDTVKTAEQSRSETRAANSVLSLCCDNVSAAYTQALRWACQFANIDADPKDVFLAIDTEFTGADADPVQLTAVMAAYQQGRLPKSDLNSYLRRVGIIDQEKTDEDIEDELTADGPPLGLLAAAAAPEPGGDPNGDQTPTT